VSKPKWMTHPEFRCTRNQGNEGVPVSGRQGYYIRAKSKKAAVLKMHKEHPRDWQGFTCALWKKAGQ
jgi:hypothetical protein